MEGRGIAVGHCRRLARGSGGSERRGSAAEPAAVHLRGSPFTLEVEAGPTDGHRCAVHWVSKTALSAGQEARLWVETRDRFGNPFFKLGANMELQCLELGVASMNRGELAEFVCTAQYAYGATGLKDKGKFKVPPRSTIRWEVELYSWSGFTGDHSNMSDAEMMDQAYHLKSKGTEYFGMGQYASPTLTLTL